MTGWYPLHIRESGEYESYDALSEEVPDWLLAPLASLIAGAFSDPQYFDAVNRRATQRCSAALRFVLPDTGGLSGLRDWLEVAAKAVPEVFLGILDWLVKTETSHYARPVEDVLASGNSVWTVGEWAGHVGLVRRVDPTTAAAAAEAISAKTTAGHHLAEAWQAAYGLNGNPSSAYSHAIKAVEFAAIPVVTPKDRGATLGKVLGQMRADGDWIVPLTRESNPGQVAGAMVAILEALWVGQSDRHGGNLPPIPITTEAARAAVLMATTLVQWFQSGAVRRGTI